MKINNPIDEFVLKALKEKGIKPSENCSDEVFVRRAYLDLIGTLPTIEESKSFISKKSASKRNDLTATLFKRDEFSDYWAMKWHDLLRIKSEYPIKLWPNAVQVYSRWIRTALKKNMPYDRFAKELLTSSGSNFRMPQVNFYRALQEKTPLKTAETVALTFMGTRINKWPLEKQMNMAAFFNKLGYKGTAEWKEEIVFFDRKKEFLKSTGGKGHLFPDGKEANIGNDTDPREVFADWLISPDNPWFAKNIVNRIWSWLFGRGLIHEPDDIRDDNPSQNPGLLTWLEKELALHNYDLRHIFKTIMESATYQLSALPSENNKDDHKNFSRYFVRRLEAEVLIDAICSITRTTEEYHSPIPEPFTFVPWKERTIKLADGSISSPFLDMFGRPPRDTGYESERNNDTSVLQIMHLLNSRHILTKINSGSGIQKIAVWNGDKKECAKNMYLAVLSRFPRPDETESVLSYIKRNNLELRESMNDLAWALINSKEFLFRH